MALPAAGGQVVIIIFSALAGEDPVMDMQGR